MKRDLELLFEVGAFRFVDRTWTHFLTREFANNAEHSFRVAWTALVIAKHEKMGNAEKILKLALMHDLAESRTGDTNYLSRQYVEEKTDLAVEDVFKDTVLEQEMRNLWKEYSQRQSIESKIVKDADQLDVDFELREQGAKGNTLERDFAIHRKKAVFPKLYTKTAKRLWNAIYATSPHDWHVNGRNRLNGGDWQPKRVVTKPKRKKS